MFVRISTAVAAETAFITALTTAKNGATSAITTFTSNSTARTQELQKYFIYTSQCRVPFVEPFEKGVSELFNPRNFNYTNCTKDESFITINHQLKARQYFLHINMEAIARAVKPLNASATDVGCCYRQIVRSGSGGEADDNFE